MKTLTVDDYQRVRLPDAKPRAKFSYEVMQDGSIKLTELAPKAVPTVKCVRVNGDLRPEPGWRPSKEAIAAAVRADRDSR
jgi:hypothetical protein